MTKSELWLWLWYVLGMSSYWLKRAYYGIAPPNPVAHSYTQYIQRSWVPLLIRCFLESMVFWVMFTPGIADHLLGALGWDSYGTAMQLITKVPPIAAVFGHAVDSITDMAVSKIPFVKDILPQMPPPLPQEAVVEAQMVKVEVTQLQSKTTVVPPAPNQSEVKP